MPKNHEIFLKHLENIFGPEDKINKHECPNGGPPVHVFIYRNVPEEGMITGVTYGLSSHPHPEWKASRPEMIISVESEDDIWGWAAAYFSAEFREEKRFLFGDVFTTDEPLASDTKMNGLLVFAQSILEKAVESVELNDYKVHFKQFYPIYSSELETYKKIGLEKFWNHPGFDMYNPRRPAITG